MSMEISGQQSWRALTPIVYSNHSPLPSRAQPAPSSRPSSHGIMSSPLLNVTGFNTAKGSSARSSISSIPLWHEGGHDASLFSGSLYQLNSEVWQSFEFTLEGSILRLMQVVHVRQMRVHPEEVLRLIEDLQIFLEQAQTALKRAENFCANCWASIVPHVSGELTMMNFLPHGPLAAASMTINCNGTTECFIYLDASLTY